MNDKPRNGVDIGLVTFEGIKYRVYITPPNCGSQKHWHEEPHADGSPVVDAAGVLIQHHHHDASCIDQPRNATLYVETKAGPPRHEHFFGDANEWNRCKCGAEREPVPLRHARTDGRRMYEYFMPADANHPEGWSWERWTDK